MGNSYNQLNGVCLVMMALMMLLLSVQMIESNTVVHRKPPFNGSIFGKRSISFSSPQQQQQQQQSALSNLINQQQQALSSSAASTFEDMILSTVDNYLVSQAISTAGSNSGYDTLAFCQLINSNCHAWYGTQFNSGNMVERR